MKKIFFLLFLIPVSLFAQRNQLVWSTSVKPETANTVATWNAAGNPVAAKVALSTHVSGTLPVANGGTGLTALGTGLQVLRTNAGATALEFATISTGITNSAAANELMKSNGTNAVASGLFASTDGNIALGSASLTGARTISAVNSTSSASLSINAQGEISLLPTSEVVSIHRDDASTNTTLDALTVRRTTSGVAAANIGGAIEFEVEQSSGTFHQSAKIETVLTNATAGAAASDMIFSTAASGVAVAEKLRIRSTGGVSVATAPTVDNTNTQILARDAVTGDLELRTNLSTLTNTATANELMKSDGTNAVASEIFSSAGQFTFGNSASSTGNNRLFVAEGTGADIGFTFRAKGTRMNNYNADGGHFFNNSTGGIERFAMTSDGRLYGTALHNNAGSITGTTNQYIASGTYTPTLTNVANVTSSTAQVTQFMRVGNVVTVAGAVTIQTTAAAATELEISLPVASNFVNTFESGGTASNGSQHGRISADATSNAVEYAFTAAGATSTVHFFTFTYLIL